MGRDDDLGFESDRDQGRRRRRNLVVLGVPALAAAALVLALGLPWWAVVVGLGLFVVAVVTSG